MKFRLNYSLKNGKLNIIFVFRIMVLPYYFTQVSEKQKFGHVQSDIIYR